MTDETSPGGVVLRPARPDDTDAANCARWLDQAAEGMFRTLLGPGSERVVAEAFRERGHDLSYEHITIAEVGGRSAGMLSAYSGTDHESASVRPMLRAAGWRGARVFVVATWLWPVLSFADRLEPDSFYVQAVAVDPDTRGSGVGTVLLDAAGTQARAAGSRRLALDVAETNVRARSLYERLGFEVTATSRPAPFLAGSRVHRMVKPLV